MGSVVESRGHWQALYEKRRPNEVSWYEPRPERSLDLIEAAELPVDAAIIDVGGGASGLGKGLLEAGYANVTVADISAAALDVAKAALGDRADEITWVVADVRDHDFGGPFDLWHDRAVFHFMVEPEDRDRYLTALRRSLNPGGHLVVATFGPGGPTRCSGLPVHRYGADELGVALGAEFAPVSSQLQMHRTPAGKQQQFLHAHLRRLGP